MKPCLKARSSKSLSPLDPIRRRLPCLKPGPRCMSMDTVLPGSYFQVPDKLSKHRLLMLFDERARDLKVPPSDVEFDGMSSFVRHGCLCKDSRSSCESGKIMSRLHSIHPLDQILSFTLPVASTRYSTPKINNKQTARMVLPENFSTNDPRDPRSPRSGRFLAGNFTPSISLILLISSLHLHNNNTSQSQYQSAPWESNQSERPKDAAAATSRSIIVPPDWPMILPLPLLPPLPGKMNLRQPK